MLKVKFSLLTRLQFAFLAMISPSTPRNSNHSWILISR